LSLFTLSVLIPAISAIVTGLGAMVSAYQVLRPDPRRRIYYRVHLDDRIAAQPDIAGLAELVVRMKDKGEEGNYQDVPNASVALVRVSNDGPLDIGESDYVRPVTFTFGNRNVVGVEVKDVNDEMRAMLLGHKHDGHQGVKEESLSFSENGDNWLQLPKMYLNKGDRFRMIVLLSGEGTGVQVSGGMLKGAPPGGGVVPDTSGVGPNRTTVRALILGGMATASLVVLSLVLFFFPQPSNSDNPVNCVAGNITVSGSTAFATAVADVADHYQRRCSSSSIAVNPSGQPTGSHRGVLDLAIKGKVDPVVRDSQTAMSDGPDTGYPALVPHPIAVIIFSVVINKAVGIHSLTTNQLQKIYSGQFTNWAQLGGQNLPIDLVSRGSDSGTRSTFDQKVLGAGGGSGSEPATSSYNCTDRDPRLPLSPVIRCETSSTEELLSLVNSTSGGLGYAEMSLTSQSQPNKYPQVDQVQLNGRGADPESVKNNQYPFWTVEYFYTYGSPSHRLLLSAFLSYLSSDGAEKTMQDYGHIPCIDDQGNQIPLCR
jgi:ABC-type phosphate transport system substrate-binding protein